MGCKFKIWLFCAKEWSNYSTLWPTAPVLRTFMQHLIAFCSRPEAASDAIAGKFVGPIVPEVCKIW